MTSRTLRTNCAAWCGTSCPISPPISRRASRLLTTVARDCSKRCGTLWGRGRAMETLETLSEMLETTGDIQSIVRTMKSLSAVSIRQYEQAEAAMSGYEKTIDLGLTALLLERRARGLPLPATIAQETGKNALIVIGSDRGLCG